MRLNQIFMGIGVGGMDLEFGGGGVGEGAESAAGVDGLGTIACVLGGGERGKLIQLWSRVRLIGQSGEPAYKPAAKQVAIFFGCGHVGQFFYLAVADYKVGAAFQNGPDEYGDFGRIILPVCIQVQNDICIPGNGFIYACAKSVCQAGPV